MDSYNQSTLHNYSLILHPFINKCLLSFYPLKANEEIINHFLFICIPLNLLLSSLLLLLSCSLAYYSPILKVIDECLKLT
jgi:hypothetical protein